jgi:hypothetical protein
MRSIDSAAATSSFAKASRLIGGWSFPITRKLRKARFAPYYVMPA